MKMAQKERIDWLHRQMANTTSMTISMGLSKPLGQSSPDTDCCIPTLVWSRLMTYSHTCPCETSTDFKFVHRTRTPTRTNTGYLIQAAFAEAKTSWKLRAAWKVSAPTANNTNTRKYNFINDQQEEQLNYSLTLSISFTYASLFLCSKLESFCSRIRSVPKI